MYPFYCIQKKEQKCTPFYFNAAEGGTFLLLFLYAVEGGIYLFFLGVCSRRGYISVPVLFLYAAEGGTFLFFVFVKKKT